MAKAAPDREAVPRFFDTHAHLVTNDYAQYPLVFAGQPGGPGGKSRISKAELEDRLRVDPPSLENLTAWFAAYGVLGACGVQYKTAYGFDNSYLLDCAAQAPDLIAPVIVADLEQADTPATLLSLAKDTGLVGVRATGFRDPKTGAFPWLESDAARASLDAIAACGLALVLMPLPPRGTGPGEVDAVLDVIADIARTRPGLRIVLDHVGWPALEAGPDFGLGRGHHALVDIRDVFFKFTTKSMVELRQAGISAADALRHFVDVFGADRIMWGSDIGNQPLGYSEMVALAHAAAAGLSAQERAQVFCDTGRQVFGHLGQVRQRSQERA